MFANRLRAMMVMVITLLLAQPTFTIATQPDDDPDKRPGCSQLLP